MRKWITTGIVTAVALNLWAQAPEMFRYQGRLVDGTNLVNATLPMSFKLYDALSNGTLLYEDSNSVLVVDGLYSTMIGDDTISGSLTDSLTNATVYLELAVGEEILLPRERLVSVPYALSVPSSVPIGDPAAVSNEIVNARWTKNIYANGDVTMSDRETGLMWLYDANHVGELSWDSAMCYCASLTYAGYSDWMLPSQVRLVSQFLESEKFANVPDTYYWSSSERASKTNYAYATSMVGGIAYNYSKDQSRFVWPVRHIE